MDINLALRQYIEKTSKGIKPYQIEEVNDKSYIDVIAEYLLDSIKNGTFDIQPYTGDKIRSDSFDFKNHHGKYGDGSKQEKPLCRSWFNNPNAIPSELKKYGIIVDYESNLVKGNKTNVDLVSFSRDNNCFYLWEVKGTGTEILGEEKMKYKTPETLLRAILEIETYYQTIEINGNAQLFKRTIGLHKFSILDREKASIKKIVVVPDDSDAAKQYKGSIKKLALTLGIDLVVYNSIQPKINKNILISKNKVIL